MSRSYKQPYYTEQNTGKSARGLAKRQAARAVRQAAEVGQGGDYRKQSDSWDIRDWSFRALPDDWKGRRK